MSDHVIILFDRKSMSFLIFIKIDDDVIEILYLIYMYTQTVSIVDKYLNKQQHVLKTYKQGYY